MLTIVLTRHGKTRLSVPEQYLGQHMDVPLSEDGRAAAQALHDRLDGVALARVIASPLQRALQTASIVAPTAAVESDARLIEADYGEWEGHTRATIRARWPDLRQAWEADPEKVAPPGGESGADIAQRVRSCVTAVVAWEASLKRPDDEHRVLLVAHSTVNRILLASALGVPLRDYRRRIRQDWANLTVLANVSDDGGLLVLDNDVSHIRGVRGITWNVA